MTLLSYLGMLTALAVPAALYFLLGQGPGAAIPAIGALVVGVVITFVVAILALAFAVIELREAHPKRTRAHVLCAGASALAVFVTLVATIRLWPF